MLAGGTLRASHICWKEIMLVFEIKIYFEIQQVSVFGSDELENNC